MTPNGGNATLEQGLETIFCEVLDRGEVDRDANFFDLGGDSLEATRVVARINERLGTDLSMPALLRHPTIDGLAREVAAAGRGASAADASRAPTPADDSAALTHAQESLWFIDQLLGPNGLYNLPFAARLRGALDTAALERALQSLVRRHGSLRTAFSTSPAGAARVVQRVEPASLAETVRLAVETPDDPSAEIDAAVDAWLERRAHRAFDLTRAPLLRAHLLRLADDDHVLLTVVHHIVSDGWSQQVMLRELGDAYRRERAGAGSATGDLPTQAIEHMRWQHERLDAAAIEHALAYWRERLRDLPTLALPADHPRPASASYRGARLVFDIDAALAPALEALARREGVTLFMVLLAAFDVLLMRHARQTDIVVGVPIAGRQRSEFEGVIGYLVNSLVLCCDLSGDPGFDELLARVRGVALDAYEHQELPFDTLVADLRPQRDLSRNPLYQVSFQLDTEAAQPLALDGLDVERLEVPGVTSKFDLSLAITDAGGALRGAIEYATDLFDPATAERLARQYTTLLAGVVAQPATPISQLPLIDAAERARLLDLGRGEALDTAPAPCLHAQVEARARLAPDGVALIVGAQQLSLGQVNARANRLARHLGSLGVAPGDFVAVCLPRGQDSPVAALAVLKAGAVYVPIDVHDPAERRAWLLRDCGARLVLTRTGADAAFATGGVPLVRLDDHAAAIDAHDASAPPDRCLPEHPACVIYTSGSTGQPKGVLVPHRGLAAHARWIAGVLGLAPGERLLHKTSPGFDASLVELLEPLAAGACIVIAGQDSERDTRALLRDLVEQRISVLQMVPTALRALLAEPGLAQCGSLRRLVSGGEALDRGLARELRRLLPQVALGNFYGPTETTIDATWHEVQDVEAGHGSVPIGRPLPHALCRVLDEHLEPVPEGMVGELFIGGAGLALGYLNRPALSDERFVADPFAPGQRLYRSADLVRWRADGRLEFVGRDDGQVKLGGVRIELGEVEAALAACPGVRECAVQLRETRPGLRQLVAYVVGETSTTWRSQLAQRLPEPMIPSLLVMLEALPMLPSGKLDRSALPAPADRSAAMQVAPRTPIELALAQIWRDVLDLPSLGVHDDFFALGGHSLVATQLAARMRSTFRIEFDLKTIFDAPSVAALADHVERRLAPGHDELVRARQDIVRCDRARSLPASFSQRRMWLLHQIDPQGLAYHMSLRLRLHGALDADALGQALARVVQRHEAFRTSFRLHGPEPEVVLGPVADAQLETFDLRELPAQQREIEAQKLLREIANRPYDLATGPLHRFALLRLADERHLLLMAMHHAVSDDWSFGLLLRELSTCYDAARRRREAELPAPAIEFADFAAWQRRALDSHALQTQWDYWRAQLAGMQPTLPSPDRPVSTIRHSHGASVERQLDRALIERIRNFSISQGATPFMTLLAAFQLLLARFTGQVDIAVGTPIANRTTLEAESLVGTLVNTLVMRTDLGGNPSFVELLARVRTASLDAFTHQDLPYDLLVERLRAQGDVARPEVQVLFNVLNVPWQAPQFEGLRCEIAHHEPEAAQLDLALHVDLDITQLAQLVIATDLYDLDTGRRLLDSWLLLLDQVLADPQRALDDYRVDTDADRRDIVAWNATRSPFDRDALVHSRVAAAAQRHPDAPALCEGETVLGHAALDAASNRLARLLRARGIGRGALVGLGVERGIGMVVAQLAILKSGAAYVPLDPDFPAERLAYMAEDAGLALLVTQASLPGLPAWPTGKRILLDDDAAAIAALPDAPLARDAARDAQPADPAYVIYTSGSTGKPKGVAVPHAAVVNFLTGMAREPGLDAGDRLLAVTTLSFDIAVLELLLPLTVGGCVVLARREQALDGTALRTLLHSSAANVMQATPSTWRLLIEAGWTGTPRMKALVGGEALPPDLARQLLERCAEVWNMYGPTETTVWSTCWKVLSPERGIRIGRPIANTQVHVLDARRRPCPIGAPGEIWIGGEGVAIGYWRRPGLSAERFVDDPFRRGARLYRTGDLGRWCHDGTLEHLGRLDHQVKVRGHRIELGEIESVLAAHPAVQRCVVIVREDRPGDVRLVAYVVAQGSMPSNAAWREHLRTSLPEYMLPQHYLAVETIPLLPNGKIDRSRLPAPNDDAAADAAEYLAPRSEHERAVAEIWQRLLGVPRVGVQDNFFDLGGHSLLAARASAEIEKALGLRVAMRRLIFESLGQVAAPPAEPTREAVTAGWLGRLFGKRRG